MGVERAVSCWYARRQLVVLRIAQIQATLAQADMPGAEKAAAQVALAKAVEELRSFGPCPRPMMG